MDLDAKIDLFSLRLAKDPHSRVFAPLADLLRQAGRVDDALLLLEDGLSRHPEYISALVIKGQTLLEAGQQDLAREVLTQAQELDRENFVVLRLLTEDARSRQAWTEAIPLLEKLVVLDPDDDRWPGALAEARKFAARDIPVSGEFSELLDSDFTTMTLVDIYLAQGYRSRALAALRQMAQREPGRKDILLRITEIENLQPTLPSGPDKSSLQDGCQPAADSENRHASRRKNEKKNFEEWIDRLRQEGRPSS